MHLMATNPSSKSDDGTNEDDDTNARDAGGADKDRVGGTGGGTMPLAGRYDVFFLECGENSTIKSTVVRDEDGATDDDVNRGGRAEARKGRSPHHQNLIWEVCPPVSHPYCPCVS